MGAAAIDRPVQLALFAPVAFDTVGFHDIAHVVDGAAAQADDLLIGLLAVGVAVGGEVVGQVDHETGIASGGTEADPPGVDEDDRRLRLQLRQATGSGQAG
ncbi:hypothetical protein D9M71_127080 [compost metagenome]